MTVAFCRTIGVTFGYDESNLGKFHSDDDVGGNRRLYMSATPRIYGDTTKAKATDVGATLATADDEDTFGPRLLYRGFGWAVLTRPHRRHIP